ncbi:helix-turn-helix domain-containing protein [Edaphobacter aggregans]|uniref:helix-turn-helix domain-containing protein n=1 Tax=Edaphobacter aggregans TaxID=570835 RepID=UPI00069161F7|nr:helix-turn-helix transcriptional regulator [Edaphobacter aggregans]
MATNGSTAVLTRTGTTLVSSDGIGTQLRAARLRLELTLREVEERSLLLGQQWGNPAYRISASWLNRVEREKGGLSATKLIVLSYIYNLTPDQMLSLCPKTTDTAAQLVPIPSSNATLLLHAGPLEDHARLWVPDKLITEPPPEETTLLPSNDVVLPSHFRRGVIGRRDRTMEPMILPGAIVLVDIQRRAIVGRREWTNEFERPIYFLFTRKGYHFGFCDLDRKSEWLTLVPHALSPEPRDMRWRYRKEVEVIGTIVGVFTRRAA